MFENGLDLATVNSLEPLQEIVDRGTVSQVLEQCRNRHARAAKHPCATHGSRVSLNGWARRPIHVVSARKFKHGEDDLMLLSYGLYPGKAKNFTTCAPSAVFQMVTSPLNAPAARRLLAGWTATANTWSAWPA